MRNRKFYFIILLLLCVMGAFAYSYIRTYNTEISARFIEKENFEVSANEVDRVGDETEIILEVYDVNTNSVYETDFAEAERLNGKSREEIESFLSEMNADITETEKAEGLKNYQLIYFSKTNLTIRKNYDSLSAENQFFLKEENGYIVVYNYPAQTIYHKTGILTAGIDEESRNALKEGIYAKDSEELFALLESFSS